MAAAAGSVLVKAGLGGVAGGSAMMAAGATVTVSSGATLAAAGAPVAAVGAELVVSGAASATAGVVLMANSAENKSGDMKEGRTLIRAKVKSPKVLINLNRILNEEEHLYQLKGVIFKKKITINPTCILKMAML